jgi:NADPH:quinone reductase-like Zn-dependent oxidoreductase
MAEAMKAVRLYEDGLKLEEIPRPEPRDGEVLVRVYAAAITRDELTWPTNRLPAIPSYELCGVVESSGEEVIALTPFDRDGVAAEWAAVPRTVLAPKPSGLSYEEAAALPMPGLTAWQGLVTHGRLAPGERVIVTGARGGVGHVAVQLVRYLGAELVDDGAPCDLLFDTAGGDVFARSVRNAGRIVTVAAEADGADYFIVEPNGAELAALPQLEPRVDSVYQLSDFAAAFQRSMERGKKGKVVLRVTRPLPPA